MEKINNYEIFFCGVSKNCIGYIENNISFINKFIQSFPDLKIKGVFVDSDSTDGTKEFLMNYTKEKPYFVYKDLDNLEAKYSNRIERISISRNNCIEQIQKVKAGNKIIYIPIDLDIDLFRYTNVSQFLELIINNFEEGGGHAIFPFSTPFYYDIFALRAKGWINHNSQYWVMRLKKYLKIASFFYNYIFIFRYQISLNKYKTLKTSIKSAFGGIGIYFINNFDHNFTYKISETHPYDVSEHVIFNLRFESLNILHNWNIPAPKQHLEYKNLGAKEKVYYFFKSFKNDFKNIIN